MRIFTRLLIKYSILTNICLFGYIQLLQANPDSLRKSIIQISKDAKGEVGVAFSVLEDGNTFTYNAENHMVMQSIMKLPIAMFVLHSVDRGVLKLDQKIHILKADLPKTYSPLGDKYPNGNIDISVAELLSYMISLSDNNACDILLKNIGGTKAVEDYVHHFGIKEFSLKATELQMSTAWQVQYTNWCRPADMVKLLNMLYKGSVLSKESNDYLWKVMLETSTCPNRMKGMLPETIQVAHKTGTGPVNKDGMNSATNDVGIVILPNKKHVAISVFINNSYADAATRDKVCARITRLIYDHVLTH